jgi:SAM-dependent methyltransferase
MAHLKQQFAQHLAAIGFDLQSPKQAILARLRERMGEQRFKAFQERHGHSAAKQEEFYSLFHDIIEANLARSLDTCATLDASFSLYERCAGRLEPGMRVVELGCWTGGLASFVAMQHPRCSVVGADFARDIVNACSAFYKLPNLIFQHWNYRFGKPESLEPGDVLLCSMGVVHHMPDNATLTDIAAVRRSHEYITQRDHAIGYFGLWRTAANDGATLYAVLRIGLFARFLAWLDAAQQTGWTPVLDGLWHADMTGEKAPLPGLVFQARKSDPLPEDAVIDKWTWFNRRDHLYACIEGGPAMAAFRALTNKTVLASRNYRREQLLTRDEIGLAAGSGYVFTHDAVFQFRLLLVSRQRAEELAAGISAKGSSTPIENDGWFQRPAVTGAVMGGGFFCGKVSSSAGAVGGGSPFSTGAPALSGWAADDAPAVPGRKILSIG